MINTDMMRAALAATPLCQNTFVKRDKAKPNDPAKLCAISACVSYAGVQPSLIEAMQEANTFGAPDWVDVLARPVMRAVYGVNDDVFQTIIGIFDAQENEWTGVVEVLAHCDRLNMDEMHEEAIIEDRYTRFPVQGPVRQTTLAGITKRKGMKSEFVPAAMKDAVISWDKAIGEESYTAIFVKEYEDVLSLMEPNNAVPSIFNTLHQKIVPPQALIQPVHAGDFLTLANPGVPKNAIAFKSGDALPVWLAGISLD